ncbi:hypothetical protein [Burkholderia ubonensis]|uniref:hypothetical protein n=1 Tax=Burkholderia ubonensis TaxID=101571 RepID=UPI000A936199|nr:hypothetical protein [Burkholderia ubonensis]
MTRNVPQGTRSKQDDRNPCSRRSMLLAQPLPARSFTRAEKRGGRGAMAATVGY